MPTPELLALSSRLTIGAAQVFRNLTVLPLIDGTAPPTGWLTLDQAIGRGVAEISEISEHGSVPQLRLRNRASEPLFLLDGEELVGAKQNRILNLTILAPAAALGDWRSPCRASSRAGGRGGRASSRAPSG